MDDFQFPVFVKAKDCGDVRAYSSVPDMQRDFEQIDVEHHEYEAWDATGMPIGLSVQKGAQWLRLTPEGTSSPEQLAIAIAEFARIQGVQIDTSGLGNGNCSGVLEQAISAIRAKSQATPWRDKFKRRP